MEKNYVLQIGDKVRRATGNMNAPIEIEKVRGGIAYGGGLEFPRLINPDEPFYHITESGLSGLSFEYIKKP